MSALRQPDIFERIPAMTGELIALGSAAQTLSVKLHAEALCIDKARASRDLDDLRSHTEGFARLASQAVTLSASLSKAIEREAETRRKS